MRTLLSFVVLAGCVPSEERPLQWTGRVDGLESPDGPPAPPLTLTGLPGTLYADSDWEVHVEGAYFMETVYLLESTGGVGEGACHPLLGGECLDVLAPVRMAATGYGMADGTVRMPYTTRTLGEVCLQAVALRGPDGAATQLSGADCITVLDPSAIQPSCQAWYDAGFRESGRYTIAPDGADAPFDVECDQENNGGGWARFWWHTPGAELAGDDMLAEDVASCDPDSPTCYAVIPDPGATDFRVLTEFDGYAIWDLTADVGTAERFRGAFFDRTIAPFREAAGAWDPIEYGGDLDWNACNSGCDSFWYDSVDGVVGFNLDDDGHWGYTAFGAGGDAPDYAGYRGVDGLTGGVSDRHVSEDQGLWLWYR